VRLVGRRSRSHAGSRIGAPRSRARLGAAGFGWLLAATSLGPLLSVAAPGIAAAATCTHNWIGPSGGSWSSSSNWDVHTTPGRSSTACAPAGSNIVVTRSTRVDNAQILGTLTINSRVTLTLQPRRRNTANVSNLHNLNLIGTLKNSAAVNLTGSGSLGGSLTGTKETVIAPGATYAITAGHSVGTSRSSGYVRNQGTILWSGGTLAICRSSVLTNQGVIAVTAPNAALSSTCGSGTKTFKNDTAGTLNVNAGLTTSLTLTNLGAFNVVGGTVQTGFTQAGGTTDIAAGAALKPVTGTATFTGGTLSGRGQVVGSVSGTSTVAPGAGGFGTLTATANFSPTTTSSLAIDLGGLTPGTGHDRLAVTGTAALKGTLALSTAPGFTPVAGQTFTVLTAASITGSFATITGANPGPNLYYVVIQSPTSIVIEVHNKPGITIGDVSIVEGDSGSQNAVFPVTLSSTDNVTVTVAWATAPGTASAGSDYTAGSGSLSFSAGQTSKTISVPILADTAVEPDETFTVNLTSPVNATIAKATGTGTIVDDDTLPTVSVDDVASAEGTGTDGALMFTVSLSNPTQKTVKVPYSTAPGTAKGNDFSSTSGTLTLAPQATSGTITVPTAGDENQEPDESLTLNLGVLVNGVIADGQGAGTIQNDDAGFTVTTTADTLDATPGDGSCETVANVCSLRAAISEANALAGEQEVRLADSETYTLGIAGRDEDANLTGDLDITDALQITGNDAIVDGGLLDRVFHVPGTTDVELADLTIRKGKIITVSLLQEQTAGGGLLLHGGNALIDTVTFTGNTGDAGGGLGNAYAALTVTDSTFTSNIAMLAGGGMLNFTGALTMTGGEFAANQALVTGGGFLVWGAANVSGTYVHDNLAAGFGGGVTGLSLDPTTKLDGVVISHNSSRTAGGLANAGYLTVTNSTIDANTATASGGGGTNAGALVITKSTISNNTAATFAGGFENRKVLQVVTSTVSGNRAVAGIGSGLYAGQGKTGEVPATTVIDTTVTASTGTSAVASDTSATTALFNSIIGAQTSGTNCFGTITSAGFNLISDGSCALAGTGDQNNVAPNLGALAANGGATMTHLPLAGSPAIGSGFPACSGTDQRGLPRPSGGTCDRGAVEQ
jgi:CSLREA domain-containing protein